MVPVHIIVECLRAGHHGFHPVDGDVAVGSVANLQRQHLYAVVRLLNNFLDGLVVQVLLALLHYQLQLPGEGPDVAVTLQAMAVGEDEHDELRSCDQETTIRNGRQANVDSTSTTREILHGLALLARKLKSTLAFGRLVG